MATATANGSAAVVTGTPYSGLTSTVARAEKTPAQRKAETYQERQDRIAESKRSLLKPLTENEGKATVCVSGEFTTLAVVYDSLFESIYPTLPPQLKAAANAQRAQAHRDMKRIGVSTLAVSEDPQSLGADRDDKALKYRAPISQLIISNLLKIRDGRQGEAIELGDITVSQAVETAFIYLFATVIAPARVGAGLVPFLGSPLTGTALESFAGYITYNTLISIVTLGGQLGALRLYQAISSSLVNQCVARVTAEQRDQAGRPSKNLRFDVPIAPIIQVTANQLALTDEETCHPISDLTLSRILARTTDYAQRMVRTDAERSAIRSAGNRIMATMRTTQIPLNIIPADPADFSAAEVIVDYIGALVPYIGGAPLEVVIGLNHNIAQGDNLAATVPLADLTVTKSLTAAYYSYYLSLWLFSTVGGLVEGQVLGTPTVGFLSPTKVIAVFAGLPLTYGLVNYHNVVRSMCLREDDATGTGRGAEANRDRATLPSPTIASTPSPRPSRAPAPRRSAERRTPAPLLPQIPGLTVPAR